MRGIGAAVWAFFLAAPGAVAAAAPDQQIALDSVPAALDGAETAVAQCPQMEITIPVRAAINAARTYVGVARTNPGAMEMLGTNLQTINRGLADLPAIQEAQRRLPREMPRRRAARHEQGRGAEDGLVRPDQDHDDRDHRAHARGMDLYRPAPAELDGTAGRVSVFYRRQAQLDRARRPPLRREIAARRQSAPVRRWSRAG